MTADFLIAAEITKTACSIYNEMKKNQKIPSTSIITILSDVQPIHYRRNFKIDASTSGSFSFKGETYNIENKPLHFHRPHLLYKPNKTLKYKLFFWMKYIFKKPLQLERWRHLASYSCNSSWDSDKIQFAPSENEANIKHLATGQSVFYLESRNSHSYNEKESFILSQEDKLFWGLYLSKETIEEIIDNKAKISFNIINQEWPFLFFDWKYFKAAFKEHIKNGKQLSSNK